MSQSSSLKGEMRVINKNTRFYKDLWLELFHQFADKLIDEDKNLEDNLDELNDAADLANAGIELYDRRWGR